MTEDKIDTINSSDEIPMTRKECPIAKRESLSAEQSPELNLNNPQIPGLKPLNEFNNASSSNNKTNQKITDDRNNLNTKVLDFLAQMGYESLPPAANEDNPTDQTIPRSDENPSAKK